MLESLPQSERKESLGKQILNALELSMEQEQALINKIEQKNGSIRIFVHPYFPSENMNLGTEGQIDFKKRDRMQEVFEKISSIEDENQAPLFILEEKVNLYKLSHQLKDKIGRNVYYIPTSQGTSTPSVDILSQKDSEFNEDLRWDRLKSFFEKLGIKRITIGGQSLTINFNPDLIDENNPYELDGCVGLAIINLEGKFEVNVSNFNYPVDRKQYLRYKNFNFDE